LEAREPKQLFRVIDERARHAMDSIVADGQRARTAIEADYPPQERSAALASLGHAARCQSAAELFAMRCGARCMDELAAQIGAPVEQQPQGDEVLVKTSRGGRLRMHLGSDTWWGLVWNTEALIRERDRAAEVRRQIQANAARYRARAEARAKGPTTSGSATGQPASGAAK
jgi:hypothetical protein